MLDIRSIVRFKECIVLCMGLYTFMLLKLMVNMRFVRFVSVCERCIRVLHVCTCELVEIIHVM